MIFNMVGGGGGSSTKSTIIVSIDTGSTVAAYSDSGYTTLVKTASEKSTGEFWLTGLDNGTYYLKATLNGDESTTSYTISEYGVYRITMSYSLYLVENGVVNSDYTATKGGYTSATISYEDGYVEIATGTVSSSYSLLYFVPTILLSEYDYLVFDGCARGYAEGGKEQRFGVVDTVSSAGNTQSTFSSSGVLLSSNALSYTTRATQYIDISAVSSSSYVGFQTAGSSYYSAAGGIKCYNFYLSNSAPSE